MIHINEILNFEHTRVLFQKISVPQQLLWFYIFNVGKKIMECFPLFIRLSFNILLKLTSCFIISDSVSFYPLCMSFVFRSQKKDLSCQWHRTFGSMSHFNIVKYSHMLRKLNRNTQHGRFCWKLCCIFNYSINSIRHE